MKKHEIIVNDVKGAEPPSGSPSSGRCPVGEQHGPGHHSTTAQTTNQRKRLEWTTKENKEIMWCYFKSRYPTKSGYLRRMFELWQQRNNNPDITGQNLADRARLIIRSKKYIAEIELEEIKKYAEGKEDRTLEDICGTSQPHAWQVPIMTDPPETLPTTFETDTDQITDDVDTNQIPDYVDREMLYKIKQNLLAIKKQDFRTPNMKQIVSRFRFKELVKQANEAAKYIETKNITETMQLVKAVILSVADKMGLDHSDSKPIKQKRNNMPPWKQRMNLTMEKKRRDLSQLTELKNKRLANQKRIEKLARKYALHEDKIDEEIEILKQEILALKEKIERYSSRCEFHRQNKLFETNQKRFYDELENKGKEENTENKGPEKKKVLDFWGNIWGNEGKHNQDAVWIKNIKEETQDIPKQENLSITPAMVRKALKKMKNWRAAGADGVQGFWLKNLTSLHEKLAEQLQIVLNGDIPNWMTTGRTSLILKNPKHPEKESNYRPITCLPTIWKLLTSVISDQIYNFLDSNNLIPWQQKGNKRKSRGTKDQLLIDKLIMNMAKRKKRNLRMIWIDYKKAYDSVPHTWILECLRIYGIADNVIAFLEKSMKTWQTLLMLNQEMIGHLLIKCGIFQGDSLSPLLFILCLIPLTNLLDQNTFGFKLEKSLVNHLLYMDDLKLYAKNEKEIDALVNIVRIFSKDICMEFGLDKCAKVSITRGKITEGTAITLPNGEEIKHLELEEQYKYLGLLESDNFETERIKTKAKEQYKRRLRLILRSKLHGRNQIQAINTYAIPVLTYPAGIIKFTQEEKRTLDTMTRKQMTMHGSLHPRADVDRLYLPRKEGGRGLLSVEDSINKEENSIAHYVENSSQPTLTETKQIMLNKEPQPKDAYDKRLKNSRKDKWHQKKLHGVWPKTLEAASPQSNLWLQKSNLKPPTEALITAAQDQALKTKWYNANILKTSKDAICRKCGRFDETVAHIISGCPELAQGVYLHRHNAVASYLHWTLSQIHGLKSNPVWYEHEPLKVVENEKIKILYDFNIYTDKKIKHRRPDLVIVNKEEGKTLLVDVACPMDHNIQSKEKEKVDHYLELKFELERLWKTKIEIVPIVIGALGAVTESLQRNLRKIGLKNVQVHQLQKCVLLKTGNILRKHL